jgi:hypothetical protein
MAKTPKGEWKTLADPSKPVDLQLLEFRRMTKETMPAGTSEVYPPFVCEGRPLVAPAAKPAKASK